MARRRNLKSVILLSACALAGLAGVAFVLVSKYSTTTMVAGQQSDVPADSLPLDAQADDPQPEPTPELALDSGEIDGLEIAVSLSTRCTGIQGDKCLDAYTPQNDGDVISVTFRDGELASELADPPTQRSPVISAGYYQPSDFNEWPWTFNLPVLDISMKGPQRNDIASVDLAVESSEPDRHPYAQVFSEGIYYGAASIYNQGAEPVSGGSIDYNITPVFMTQTYGQDTSSIQCDRSRFAIETQEQYRAFMEDRSVNMGETYAYHSDIPAFRDLLIFAPLDKLADAAPEITPQLANLAPFWQAGLKSDKEPGGAVAIGGDVLSQYGAGGDKTTYQDLQSLQKQYEVTCLPNTFLVDARMTLTTQGPTAPVSKTLFFRTALNFITPELGGAGFQVNFADAVRLKSSGSNYRVNTPVRSSDETVRQALFASKSSFHRFHIEVIGRDGRLLWRSKTISLHYVMPGYSFRQAAAAGYDFTTFKYTHH